MSNPNQTNRSRPIVVLLVDDDADSRTLMRDALNDAGLPVDVRQAAGGHEAMEYLRDCVTSPTQDEAEAQLPRPDLIVLDVELPDANGHDILRKIRANTDWRDIPVLVATSLSDESQQARAMEAGASGFAAKPITPAAFARTVAELTSGAAPRVGPPRILLIEDDPDQRDLLREALCLHYDDPGCITTVASGRDCLQLDLRSFDVALLDYNLPDVPGLKLLKELVDRANLPVIFVTGQNDSQTAAQAIRAGAEDYVIKLGDYLFALPVIIDKSIRQHQMKAENHRLQQQLRAMLRQLQNKNEQLENSMGRLEQMASTDALTMLANRRRFGDLLRKHYEEAVRYEYDLTCCMADLDQYKGINDTLGHQIGDELLILTADVIRDSLRSSDVAARYGGDEFVLLLPHTSSDRACAVAGRIRRELAKRTSEHSALRQPVTISVGVASLMSNHPATADALVAMADRALYDAKDLGRDRIISFSPTARGKTGS